jgi:hypothetical protein
MNAKSDGASPLLTPKRVNSRAGGGGGGGSSSSRRQVYVVFDSRLVAVPPPQHGLFSSRNCYAVVSTTTSKATKAGRRAQLRHIVYFWQGRTAAADDVACWRSSLASGLLTGLARTTGVRPSSVSVFQHKEPSHFLAVFANVVVVYDTPHRVPQKAFSDSDDSDHDDEADAADEELRYSEDILPLFTRTPARMFQVNIRTATPADDNASLSDSRDDVAYEGAVMNVVEVDRVACVLNSHDFFIVCGGGWSENEDANHSGRGGVSESISETSVDTKKKTTGPSVFIWVGDVAAPSQLALVKNVAHRIFAGVASSAQDSALCDAIERSREDNSMPEDAALLTANTITLQSAATRARLRAVADGRAVTVNVVREGSESNLFWALLGGKAAYARQTSLLYGSASISDGKEADAGTKSVSSSPVKPKVAVDQLSKPRLFHCSHVWKGGVRTFVASEEPHLTQDVLTDSPRHVFVLDLHVKAYIWSASSAGDDESPLMTDARAMAEKYITASRATDGRPHCPLLHVRAGDEPLLFISFFWGWRRGATAAAAADAAASDDDSDDGGNATPSLFMSDVSLGQRTAGAWMQRAREQQTKAKTRLRRASIHKQVAGVGDDKSRIMNPKRRLTASVASLAGVDWAAQLASVEKRAADDDADGAAAAAASASGNALLAAPPITDIRRHSGLFQIDETDKDEKSGDTESKAEPLTSAANTIKTKSAVASPTSPAPSLSSSSSPRKTIATTEYVYVSAEALSRGKFDAGIQLRSRHELDSPSASSGAAAGGALKGPSAASADAGGDDGSAQLKNAVNSLIAAYAEELLVPQTSRRSAAIAAANARDREERRRHRRRQKQQRRLADAGSPLVAVDGSAAAALLFDKTQTPCVTSSVIASVTTSPFFTRLPPSSADGMYRPPYATPSSPVYALQSPHTRALATTTQYMSPAMTAATLAAAGVKSISPRTSRHAVAPAARAAASPASLSPTSSAVPSNAATLSVTAPSSLFTADRYTKPGQPEESKLLRRRASRMVKAVSPSRSLAAAAENRVVSPPSHIDVGAKNVDAATFDGRSTIVTAASSTDANEDALAAARRIAASWLFEGDFVDDEASNAPPVFLPKQIEEGVVDDGLNNLALSPKQIEENVVDDGSENVALTPMKGVKRLPPHAVLKCVCCGDQHRAASPHVCREILEESDRLQRLVNVILQAK